VYKYLPVNNGASQDMSVGYFALVFDQPQQNFDRLLFFGLVLRYDVFCTLCCALGFSAKNES